MTQPATRPYAFDTEFDNDGAVVRPSAFRPTKRSYLPAEVEVMVAQARLEAREAALAEIESIQAMAVAAIGQALAASAPALAQIVQNHREQSAELALAAGRSLASAALDRFPQGPIQSALEALAQEIDASPRLTIHVAGLTEESRGRIERLCADAGFTGVVAFREAPAMPVAAFQLEWADGRADFDPVGAANRITEAVASALAAEAGHAEPLPHGSAY